MLSFDINKYSQRLVAHIQRLTPNVEVGLILCVTTVGSATAIDGRRNVLSDPFSLLLPFLLLLFIDSISILSPRSQVAKSMPLQVSLHNGRVTL
jgi:SpoU rRNA methylase family enzyme